MAKRKAARKIRYGKPPRAVTLTEYTDGLYPHYPRFTLSCHGTFASAMARYKFFFDCYHRLHGRRVWVEEVKMNTMMELEPMGGPAHDFNRMLKNFGIYQGEFAKDG